MTLQAFLILKDDNTAWILTFEPETKTRAVYEFHSWLLDKEPASAIEPVEPWLEHEGSAIEAAYPIHSESKHIDLNDSNRLEYTELLDEISMY